MLTVVPLEYLKIISLLAKKSNISVIGHAQGTNNFINNYPNNKSIPIFKKNTQGFNSLDYYIAWGKNKLCDVWDNVEIENNITLNHLIFYLTLFNYKILYYTILNYNIV